MNSPAAPSSTTPGRANWRFVAAAFVIFGAFLRLYNFTGPELWLDEYGTWWVVAGDGFGDAANRAVEIHGQSPVYYLIVKVFTAIFGMGPLGLRLPSMLFGLGVLAVSYPLGLALFGNRHAALITLGAFAVNERLIFYSQEARPYSLALLCALLSFLFFLHLLKSEHRRTQIAYAIVTAAMVYVHYLFGVLIVVQVAYVLTQPQWWRPRLKSLLVLYGAIAVALLPGVIQLASLFDRREALTWLSPPQFLATLTVLMEALNPWVFAATALVVTALGPRRSEEGQSKDLILWWLLLPIGLFGLISVATSFSLLHARYVLCAFPAAVLASAWLMSLVSDSGWRRWAPLGVFATVSFIWVLQPAIASSGVFAQWLHQGFREATLPIVRDSQPDDLVVYRSGFVEADRLTDPNLDDTVVSFMEWPVRAHLSKDHTLLGLPARNNRRTAPYLGSVMQQALQHRRVWVIGMGDLTGLFADKLKQAGGYTLKSDERHGKVATRLLERPE